MNGILNINKPQGETSFGVVTRVKRLLGERRVGHAGTLDPMATGVLPVCFGQATRIVEYINEATKVYRARIELGVITDTYDASGTITGRIDPSLVSREKFRLALDSFHGAIQQTPPMYSAIKCHGKPLYQLARAGLKVELQSRPAQIYRLELMDWAPPFATIEMDCGKGTYVRSLAHDIGTALGCGATLVGLVRLRYGLFDIRDSVSMIQLEDACRDGCWRQLVHPMDIAISHWPAAVINEVTAAAVRNGRPVHLDSPDAVLSNREQCRAYTVDGNFLAIMRFDSEKGHWQPVKVLASNL